MANDVYANGREIACKSGSGKSPAAFPDVCFTPPQTPATPPGAPVPYPNTGFERDTSDGSRTVKISKKEVMLKNKSYFKKSVGNEAGSAPKKGAVTSVNRGKVYFIAWSMDVKVEGENVVRNLDLTTHNHASPVANTPPFPDLSKLKVGRQSCKKILAKEGLEPHQHKDKDCPKGYNSDHILQNACFENRRGGGGITTAPTYNTNQAPCICLYDNTRPRTQHGKKTAAQNRFEKKLRRRGRKTTTYGAVRDANLQAVRDSKSPQPSEKAMKCLKLVVDHYFKKHLGLTDNSPVRVPRTGRFRRPPGTPR